MWADSPGPTSGSGQLAELLRPSLPRSRIPHRGRRKRSYPSPPLLFNSRRAARVSRSPIQAEMLTPADWAACRIISSCSGNRRMRRAADFVFSALGLAMPLL